MHFVKSSFIKLVFSNRDWVGSDDAMMSTSGYCFAIGGSIFCWNSKKQSLVAYSTAKDRVHSILCGNKAIDLLKENAN